MSNYLEFLASKKLAATLKADVKIDASDVHHNLFDFQKDVVVKLVNMGGGAGFLDTGLGKTIIQCECARLINRKTLFVAPLAVAHQTCREAKKLLDMDIVYSKDGTANSQFTITNYERLGHFDHSSFDVIILDESSILKGQTSKTRAFLCEAFRNTPYKFAFTATPAPNDYMELGNHADFLGIMSQQEMLTRWFVHDSANTADWRLKGHAVKPFWEWVASWAACLTKPSDIGYSDDGYDLPALVTTTHMVNTDIVTNAEQGTLFDLSEVNATSINRKMRETVHKRVEITARMANTTDQPVIVWCESNEESTLLKSAIPDAVEVKGSDSPDSKEQKLMAFTDGTARVIVSKPSICGHGMNWQHCRRQIFCSTRYSYEYYYQAVRRSYRFGQTESVEVDVLIPDNAIQAWRAIERKANDHKGMKEHMRYASKGISKKHEVKIDYNPQMEGSLPSWLQQ